ncbi:4a-hydroxytetrahydrobiopterin dehydratase [Beijerinckia indica]|uniref:4a-hydroxytetrahydrobiopterin dehydratase n=1 Tax=Beijerinckia indica subsp. indica (strain ATCC 9039 / DSM 1715 / NCIMB 8712) TaxID=395963 RepID=B2IG60_BEII9|nr:4a-hydroxytetrahydrobiopterin dehydratase [Beijerinckia indica]ACB97134.1 transcriptional coactivator/pterin dehydratase [Beijerinckia indica subsp. indica ATCC 9039]
MTELVRDHIYQPAEIEEKLKDLPFWFFAEGAIRRRYKTSGWKATLMVVNTVGHLCEAAWHHPEIKMTYAGIEIALSTHSPRGITEKDFALARKIEEVIFWQPGREGGVLEGTPRDAAFAYIDYDD